jgi:predicted HTH domain antitoxin
MPVVIEFPKDIEESLRQTNPNLERDATEAYAVELFRKGALSHYELSRALGIDRFETDEVLVRHKCYEQSVTHADVERDVETLRTFPGDPSQ